MFSHATGAGEWAAACGGSRGRSLHERALQKLVARCAEGVVHLLLVVLLYTLFTRFVELLVAQCARGREGPQLSGRVTVARPLSSRGAADILGRVPRR